MDRPRAETSGDPRDRYAEEARRRVLLPESPPEDVAAAAQPAEAPNRERSLGGSPSDRRDYVAEAMRRGLIDEDPYAAEARRRGLLDRLTDDEVGALRARGENVAESRPYTGFWDRARQTFREHRNLDQNVVSLVAQRLFGGREIDPATGKPLTEDQIRARQNERRERERYLLAGAEPAEGILEHVGDVAGVIGKEMSAPTAIATAPIGGAASGLARIGKLAGVGGMYEGVAGTAEQLAEEGEITDPGAIAERAAIGAVGAPVLDTVIQGAAKGVGAAVDMGKSAVERLRRSGDEAEFEGAPAPAAAARAEPSPSLEPEQRERLEAYLEAPDLPEPGALDPRTDDLLEAVAKLGGIDRVEGDAEGIDPKLLDRTVGERSLFPEYEGRTMAEMADLLDRHGYTRGESLTPDELAGRLSETLVDEVHRSGAYDPSLEASRALRDAGGGLTVPEVQTAIRKALAGEKLGIREARAVDALLEGDATTGIVERELANARRLRRDAAGDGDLGSELTAIREAGSRFGETDYPPEWDGETRALYELARDAQAVDRGAAREVLEREGDPIETAKALHGIAAGEPGSAVLFRLGEKRAPSLQVTTEIAGERLEMPSSGANAKPAAAPPSRVDDAAHEAATSPRNALPEPTEAQKAAGTYRKGHARIQGLDVSIENPKGSLRSGFDADGEPWSVEMQSHYGYIRRTDGADGEQIDVFLGPEPENPDLPVFVVNQKRAGSGRFDEHKALLGHRTREEAERAYLANYAPDWLEKQGGALDVVAMPMPAFKGWIERGDGTKPAAALEVRTLPGKGGVEVRGDPGVIRRALKAAGTDREGMPGKRGLVFNAQHEGPIRAALELPDTAAAARSSFAPGERYVGFIEDSAPSGDRGGTVSGTETPLRREDVLRPFLKALGVPLYEGRVKGKSRLGFYLPKKEAVRVKKRSDLEVAAHELAHLLDDRVPEIRGSWRKGPKARVHQAELKGVSYDQSKIYEGFAEYVRLWMTQNEKARAAAPEFTRWWEEFVEKSEYGPAIKTAQRGMTAWFEQDALLRAKSKIGMQKPLNDALDGPLDKFRQSVSDDLHGIYAMERRLTGKVSPHGAYETARLSRASYSMVDGAIELGHPVVRPDGSHAFAGKGLREILSPIAKDLDNWILYAVGRSARELKQQGRENLFTKAEIEAMLSKRTVEFAKVFDDYQAWNKAVVDFAETKGLINPASRALWRRTEYLPFYRTGQPGATKRAKGIEGHWNGIRRLTGGTGNLRDVLGNMVQNASHLMTEALRNEVRLEVVKLASSVKGGGRFLVKIPKDTRPQAVDKEQLRRFVYELLGLDARAVKAGRLPEGAEEAVLTIERQLAAQPGYVQFWMHGQAPTGDNVIAVMRGGKPEFYEVGDPVLYRAFASLNRPAKHWLVKALSVPKRVGQASITLTPDFMAANLARDTLMASVMSRHGFKPFLDSARGMKSRLAKDDAYREFIANGGGFASYFADDDALRNHLLRRFYGRKRIDYRSVIDTPAKLLYLFEHLADAVEMSARLGEFKRARAAGAHPRHAAYLGREVSTDFAMRGDSQVLGFLYDTAMFLKAGINGLDRAYRGIAHDPNRLHIAAKTGALALTSAALYTLNRGNPLYEQMEDWKKDVHWHFFVPTERYYDFVEQHGREPATPEEAAGRYRHFYYPKIWEIGAVASIAERTMEQLYDAAGEGDADLQQYGRDVARVTMDLFKLEYMPQAIAPIVEQAINRNRFTNRPIETQAMESLEPWARAKPYTSKLFQDLGEATRNLPRPLQVPPARAEALLRGYFNTWALYGLGLTDAAMDDGKPKLRLDEYPVLRRFYAEVPARHTKHATTFYDMLRKATELRRTMRYFKFHNRRPDLAEEYTLHPELLDFKQLDRTHRALQGFYRQMRDVRRDELLTPEKKREELDWLTAEKNKLLRETVEDIEGRRTGR